MDVRNEPDGGPGPGPEPEPEPGADAADAAGVPRVDPGAMTVEVGGTTRRLPAEHDYTGDGQPDAAVETPDGTVVVFADTEDNETGEPGPDGRADEAYVVDKRTGRVLTAAHLDPGSGSWVSTEGDPVEVPTGSGSTPTEPGRAAEQDPTGAMDPARPGGVGGESEPAGAADPDLPSGVEEARAD